MALDFILLFSGGALLSFFTALVLNHFRAARFLKLFIKSGRVQDIHKGDIYRIGGVIILFSTLTILFLYQSFPIKGEWLALIAGAFILLIGSILDDLFDLKPIWQFLSQSAGALTFIFLGNVKINFISAPIVGEVIFNDFFAVFIPFILIIFFINIFNFLDGVDGVAAGVGFLSFLAIFVISLLLEIKQIPPAVFSVCGAGALFGLLFVNKPPAKIFLGTSGSNIIGFLIGSLSIIAGSKILTLLVVSILPAIDAFTVIARRLKQKRNVFQADASHLHHILLKKGISQKKIFAIYTVLTAFFTVGALLLQNYLKLVFFVFLAFIAFLLINKIKT